MQQVAETYFATSVMDPYRWLENAADPKVEAWNKAQNTLTAAISTRSQHERP
jgi:prolyl oligopeptidase